MRLEHGAAQIAAAHAELDGHVALLLLAIDERGAGHQAHVGHILEWNLNDASGGGLRRDRDASDGLEILPKRRGQPHHHRKMPVAAAFVQIAGALAADGRLHHRIDVAGRQTVARGTHPIHVDANSGLAE